MKTIQRHLRLAVMVGVVMAAAATWITSLAAETDSEKPRLRQIMEKPSAGAVEVERTASGIPEDALGRGTPRSSVRRIATMLEPPNTLISGASPRIRADRKGRSWPGN